jgi:hypothetical protein
MGIGFSIFLLAVGAILKFAVHATVAGVDIRVVGVILMVAGVLGLILTMVILAPRRRRTITESRDVTTGGSTAASSNVNPKTEVHREVTEEQN